MTARLEKRLQALTMIGASVLAYLDTRVLSKNSVYPATVLAAPFISGLLFVFLTRKTSRGDKVCLLFSLVNTIGLGAIGMLVSHTFDATVPYTWLVECHQRLWRPLGDSACCFLTIILFILVPIGCFILGRTIAERFSTDPTSSPHR